jgi:Na+-transporting NADH:ubiquinone oxidoreductase subunit NqrB
MSWFNDTEAGRAVQSYVKVFAAVVLGFFLADGADVFAVSVSDLRTWLAAGIAAVVPLLINVLNPKYDRYGIGAK